MEASINISYETVREARAVVDAVAPDNVKVPKGLVVKTSVQGVKVSTKITCETRLETFIATVDDLLSAVSVAEKTVSIVKNK